MAKCFLTVATGAVVAETDEIETPKTDPVKDAIDKVEIKPAESTSPDNDDGEIVQVPLYVQIPWVLSGSIGLIVHVFMSKDSSFPFHPLADGISLAWLAFAFIGASINYVREIGIPGGGKLAFRRLQKTERAVQVEKVSAASLRSVIVSYAVQMQSWMNSVNLFTEHLRLYGKSSDDKDEIVARFCLERMEEAKELIAESDDMTRLSLWWYIEEVDGLVLIFSDDIRDQRTLDHVFRPGAGLCGQCYIENRCYNLSDAPNSIYYEPIIDVPQYHGLLLMPVQHGTGRVMGVLSIDRVRKEEFGDTAIDIARALSDLLVYALCHPEADSIYAPETKPDVLTE